MNLKEHSISGFFWTGGSALFYASLQGLQLLFLARLLTPADFGLMGLVTIVTVFGQGLVDCGISNAIVQRQITNREQLSSLYWLNLTFGGVIFLVVFTGGPLLALFFEEPRLEPLLRWASFLFLLVVPGQQPQMLLQRDLKFRPLAQAEILAGSLGVAISIFAATRGEGAFSLVYGNLVMAASRSLLLIRQTWGEWRPSLHFHLQDLAGLWKFGLFQMGERSVNYFNSRIDQLLIGKLLGTDSLGYYSFASNLVFQPVYLAGNVIQKVTFPVFSKLQEDLPRLRNAFLRIYKSTGTLVTLLFCTLLALSPWFIPTVFGNHWNSTVPLIRVLAGVAWIRSLVYPMISLLLAQNRAGWIFKLNLAVFLVTPPALYAGVVQGGLFGAAMSLFLVQAGFFCTHYLLFIRKLVGDCATIYLAALMKPLGAGIALLAGVEITNLMIAPGLNLLGLLISGTGALLFFLMAFWAIDRSGFREILAILRTSATADSRS